MRQLLCLICLVFLPPVFANEIPEPYRSLTDVLPYDGFSFFGRYNKEALERLVKANDVKYVIEVGAFLGASTRFFAKAIPSDGKVYAIDHWKGNVEHQNSQRDVYGKLPKLYEQFLSNVIHAKLCHKIIPVKMDSLEAAKVLTVKPDLIYIDASHDYDSVLKDLKAWFPFVESSGILCGDDWSWPGVRKAVVEFAAEKGLNYSSYGNFWWYH